MTQVWKRLCPLLFPPRTSTPPHPRLKTKVISTSPFASKNRESAPETPVTWDASILQGNELCQTTKGPRGGGAAVCSGFPTPFPGELIVWIRVHGILPTFLHTSPKRKKETQQTRLRGLIPGGQWALYGHWPRKGVSAVI